MAEQSMNHATLVSGESFEKVWEMKLKGKRLFIGRQNLKRHAYGMALQLSDLMQ